MRPTSYNLSALLATAVIAAGSALTAGTATAANAAVAAIPGSFSASTDADIGEFSSSSMSVEIVLAPNNETQLDALLTSVYNPNDPNYHQWLGTGEFNSRFAPTSSQVAAIESHLQSFGLAVQATDSPFLLRASGPSSVIAAAFGTSIHNYRNAKGINYFSNAAEVQLPVNVAAVVRGVVGLSNTVRLHSHLVRPAAQSPGSPSCEAPYVTAKQLFAFVNAGTPYAFGYGGGPGCNGLTPAQTNSIYGAPKVGSRGQGAGVNLAVFELSAYLHSDIATWAHYFYGPWYTPPLVDITVDGGPLNPKCPVSTSNPDQCPAAYNGYSGDIEVDADIETQLAISPAAQHILVYNAPNDFTGQTELDEYSRIANDNRADVISSSWGGCEFDVGVADALAENLIFEQMALQGQSMLGAAGDTGAFDCLRGNGETFANVDDPPSQPWVTSVGGTSLERFNPGADGDPGYPYGIETVWNVDNLCNTSGSLNPPPNGSGPEGNLPGLFWCAYTGAGGGGSSQFWGRPFYQQGPGVTNANTTYANRTTNCTLAARGTPCREVPDISANADAYTPYAEYCTGSAATNSTCATFSGAQTPAGWFGIGGTSLSSPLWSGIIANRVSYWNGRVGNLNPLLYLMFNTNYAEFFNDITGRGQRTNNNGLYPTTPGYDLATGIGTPRMGALITGYP